MCKPKIETHTQAPPPPPPPPPNESPAPPVVGNKDPMKKKKRGLRSLTMPLAPASLTRSGLNIPQA